MTLDDSCTTPVQGPIQTAPGFACLAASALGAAWAWAAGQVSVYWYFLINRLLHHSVPGIDDQPLWAATLQNLLMWSPVLGFVAVFLLYGVRQRRWLVPVAYLLGCVCYEAYSWHRFIETMRQFD